MQMWRTSYVREMGCDTRRVIRTVLYAAMLDNHPILQTCGKLNECCQVLVCHLVNVIHYLQVDLFMYSKRF